MHDHMPDSSPDSVLDLYRAVLAGIAWPAPRWRVITEADLYGADSHSRRLLYALPPREYLSCTDVVATLRWRLARPQRSRSWQGVGRGSDEW